MLNSDCYLVVFGILLLYLNESCWVEILVV